MSARIRRWPQFARRIRPGNEQLLQDLPRYPGSIFVAGCQRSGGTMLARELNRHPDVLDCFWSRDAELDAALILSGTEPVEPPPAGKRYCFQTTYLNDRWVEYAPNAEHFHLIWLIRNPYSVVYSMLYNWRRFALNEVFDQCGVDHLPEALARRRKRWGRLGVAPLDRAAMAYLGKLEQCRAMLEQLPQDRFTTLQYETLVTEKAAMTAQVYAFAGLAPLTVADTEISTRSLGKADKLRDAERARVTELCGAAYESLLADGLRLTAS